MYFCEDIKRHIISFLGAKPMKLTNLDDIADLIHKWGADAIKFPALVYHLRMRMSFEQLQFEQSYTGIKARERYVARLLEQCKRRDVQAELLQYHVLAANDFNGVFRIPDSFHRVKWEAHILQLLLKIPIGQSPRPQQSPCLVLHLQEEQEAHQPKRFL